MPLHALIDKYQTGLAIPYGTGIAEIVERYSPFGQELVRLPSFPYTRYNMFGAVAHMRVEGFSYYARREVAAYAMRRAAIEAIPNTNAREEIWRLLELGHLLGAEGEGMQRIKEAAEEYAKRVGIFEVKGRLLMAQEEFGNVGNEVRELYRITHKLRELYKMAGEFNWVQGFAESHGERIAPEIMRLQAILVAVKDMHI